MTTTYDSAIDTLMGDKLMLFVTDGSSTLPIAFGTSCNIDLGYTISSESMISFKEGHLSFKKLKDLMASRIPVDFIMAKAKETNGDFAKDAEVVKGKAIITALNMTAQNGAICTSSCTLQGTGPLEDGAVSAGG